MPIVHKKPIAPKKHFCEADIFIYLFFEGAFCFGVFIHGACLLYSHIRPPFQKCLILSRFLMVHIFVIPRSVFLFHMHIFIHIANIHLFTLFFSCIEK